MSEVRVTCTSSHSIAVLRAGDENALGFVYATAAKLWNSRCPFCGGELVFIPATEQDFSSYRDRDDGRWMDSGQCDTGKHIP